MASRKLTVNFEQLNPLSDDRFCDYRGFNEDLGFDFKNEYEK